VSKAWPKVSFGKVLKQVRREYKVDATKEYALLGARWYAKGLYVKDRKLGSDIRASSLFSVKTGDFVYNRLFAWKGSFAVATESEHDCFVSNEFPCFEVNRAKLDPAYLLHYFSREAAWAEALGLSSGATPTSRNRLKEVNLLGMEIPLPPLPEQRRIVAKIEELVVKIEEARELRKWQEQAAHGALLGAFWHIAKNARTLPMQEVAPQIRRPVEVVIAGMYPELGIRSFGKGTFHKPALSGAEIGNKRIFWIKPGDLLLSNVFAWEGAIAVAKADDDNRVGSHRYITCVPRKEIATAAFLCFYFLTPEGLDLIRGASPGGAGRNRTLGLAALDAIQVPVPPLPKQHWFDDLQFKAHDLTSETRAVAAEVGSLLPSILDRAFKGEM
jgi:type I restriction enzyme S subunit